MIELTSMNGETFWANPTAISLVEPSNGTNLRAKTTITFHWGEKRHVAEPPDEVSEMICSAEISRAELERLTRR